jgi:hypothetical protein
LRVEFQGSQVTSNGDVILVHELDERLGFSDLIAHHIADPSGQEHAVLTRRLDPAIGLSSLGGL